MTILKRGSKGDMVKAVQYIVGAAADGIFGAKTETAVMNYQKRYGLDADGIVGRNTYRKIVDNAPTLRFGSTGIYVNVLEVLITKMKPDGIYSSDEIAHVKTYQASKDLEIDGVVGKKTWSALFGLDSSVNVTTTTNNGTNTKQPVYYLQGDSRWKKIVFTKNNTYDRSQTIGSSGCGITCAAMIIATWWDKSITPKQTAAECVTKGYRTPNSGTDPGYFRYIANKYHASKYITTDSYETAKNIVEQGGLVIVNVGKSVWTRGGHYILWWKVDGNKVYINDPASKASNRVKNTASTLDKATKGYYCFLK